MLNTFDRLNVLKTPLRIKTDAKKQKQLKVAPELRHLIRESVALLGQVIKRELGEQTYSQIENIRVQMTLLRKTSDSDAFIKLSSLKKLLETLSPQKRYEIGHAFTLMIQLMNVSENAYRSHRLKLNKAPPLDDIHPESITWVLTAHPTESRSPQNMTVFHQIQKLLGDILITNELEKTIQLKDRQKEDLFHLLEVAWRTPVMRRRKPKVKDEAESLYKHVFREQILNTLMNSNSGQVKLRLHSWIGSDKDGHPGVHEKTLLQSLNISRREILNIIDQHLLSVRETLSLTGEKELLKLIMALQTPLKPLRTVKPRDAGRVQIFKVAFSDFLTRYNQQFGVLHPSLRTLSQLLELFPGLVIPMELREASDLIMARAPKNKTMAIDRMLMTVAKVSRGGEPRWYARSLIISMTESALHLKTAALKQKKHLGSVILPVVPLFEEAHSLANSAAIMSEVFKDNFMNSAIKNLWNSKVELMVGYSDSSKEAGVFPSRLAIAEALPRLEKVCRQHQVIPVFFHGSGGSVDRGGGTIENQTAWWPKSAVNNFKVTVQGEMIERWLASPMIARRQLEKISQCATDVLKKNFVSPENQNLKNFANSVTVSYRRQISDPDFLQIVKQATPYAMMSYLKLGSRPTRRTKDFNVKGLRAIPWILCWVQTRLLFPVWWGAGLAWEQSTPQQKKALHEAYDKNPVFNSYIKALDFTLAKVELSVFNIYLHESRLPQDLIQKFSSDIEQEYWRTVKFCKSLTRSNKLLSSQQWLQESVVLRAPMIHPLNLLQNIAIKNKELNLLRLTVTGISSGMMSTG